MANLFRKFLIFSWALAGALTLLDCRLSEKVSGPAPEEGGDTLVVDQDSILPPRDSLPDTLPPRDSLIDTLPSGNPVADSPAVVPVLDSLHLLEGAPFDARLLFTPPELRRIHLVGKVIDRKGDPVAGAVAELAGSSLADTTDAHGRYDILLLKDPPLPLPKPAADPSPSEENWEDSLVISKDDHVVAVLDVRRRLDTLPDIRVHRRSLTGTLAAVSGRVHGLMATVLVEGDSAHVWDLRAESGEAYSGLAFFTDSSAALPYTVHVSALDEAGRTLGRSDTVRFQPDVEEPDLPAFDPLNGLPSARASAPERARISRPLELSGTAEPGLGGPVAKMEWDVGNTGTFVAADPDGGLLAAAPAQPRERFLCVLRVTDSAGLTALDTAAVFVEDDPFRAFKAYWGDLHSHSSFSSDVRPGDSAFTEACRQDPACAGLEGPAYLFRNARNERLDFTVVTDHAEDLTAEEWERTRSMVGAAERPGAFVPFMGYEYCDSVSGIESCANIVFPGTDKGRLYAGKSLLRADTLAAAEFLSGEAELWPRLAASDPEALAFVPHPAEGHLWGFSEAKRRFVVGAEVSSTGGSPAYEESRLCYSPWLQGLMAGDHLAAAGAGNDHSGHPGRAALTGLYAAALTREALFEAMRARRIYATRGARVIMRLDVDGIPMGGVLESPVDSAGTRRIRITAEADFPTGWLQTLTIMRVHDGLVETVLFVRGEERSLRAVAEEVLEAGESAFYWAEVTLDGQNLDFGSEAWTSPVKVRILP